MFARTVAYSSGACASELFVPQQVVARVPSVVLESNKPRFNVNKTVGRKRSCSLLCAVVCGMHALWKLRACSVAYAKMLGLRSTCVSATVLLLCAGASAFNLEDRNPIVKRGEKGSYFGYSVAEHKQRPSGDGSENWWVGYFRIGIGVLLAASRWRWRINRWFGSRVTCGIA